MNILGLIPQTYGNLILFILMLTRITSLFSTFILFQRKYVNARVVISLSSVLALYAILITQNQPPKYELFSFSMTFDLIMQALIGFVSGLILNIIFEIFTALGQIISTQIGFSMVTLIDPTLGAITPLTLFYNYFAILIFLLLNGHLIVIQLILDSFISIPINSLAFPFYRIKEIVIFTNNIFSTGISLSITIIISMLLTNITIAVMSRFAPQFNIFSVGINITMILGLIFVYLTFNLLVSHGEDIFQNGFLFLSHIILGTK